MPEYLKFRSGVTSVYDYRLVDLSEYVPAFTPDAAELERDLKRQRSRHGIRKECDSVLPGDMVTLSCRSENPKFCKTSTVIPVGSGLFHAELEEQLVGQKKNEVAELSVGGEKVSVRIEKIVRTLLPELNDETVRDWGMPGVGGVADLKKYCVDRQIDKFLDDCENADTAAARVWAEVGERSTFALDADEEAEVLALAAADAGMADEQGATEAAGMTDVEEKAEDAMTADAQEAAEEASHAVESAEDGSDETTSDEGREEERGETDVDFATLRRRLCLIQLQMAVIGQKMAEEAGDLLTREDYEAYLQRCGEAYPETSEEKLAETCSPLKFMLDQYGDRMAKALDQYVLGYLKHQLNP